MGDTAIVPEIISECSLVAVVSETGVCSSLQTVQIIKEAYNLTSATAPQDVIEAAKEITSCETEKCVLSKHKNNPIISTDLSIVFKLDGPLDSTLLNNYHIDGIMKQWSIVYKNFYAYNFNMRNYTKYSFNRGRIVAQPDTLETIPVSDLFASVYETAGCVVNTDVYQGGGKHWMALFVDVRTENCTIEFFNSSGNPPSPEWINWMVKTKHMLDATTNYKKVEMVKVCNIRHQKSKTECGVYSLYYIFHRLRGVEIEHFKNTSIDDKKMFEFRQHLFEGSDQLGKKFDFEEYSSKVKILWE